MINPINFFKSRAKTLQTLKSLDFTLWATAKAGEAYAAKCAVLKEQNASLEAQNAHLTRQLAGFKAGQTRRERKAIVNEP